MGLLNWFRKNKEAEEELLDIDVCPNCWGHQEYGGKFRIAVEDPQKNILNKDSASQKAFVQQFVEDNITGIRLKKDGDQMVCPSCNTGYKYVSDKAN